MSCGSLNTTICRFSLFILASFTEHTAVKSVNRKAGFFNENIDILCLSSVKYYSKFIFNDELNHIFLDVTVRIPASMLSRRCDQYIIMLQLWFGPTSNILFTNKAVPSEVSDYILNSPAMDYHLITL